MPDLWYKLALIDRRDFVSLLSGSNAIMLIQRRCNSGPALEMLARVYPDARCASRNIIFARHCPELLKGTPACTPTSGRLRPTIVPIPEWQQRRRPFLGSVFNIKKSRDDRASNSSFTSPVALSWRYCDIISETIHVNNVGLYGDMWYS